MSAFLENCERTEVAFLLLPLRRILVYVSDMTSVANLTGIGQNNLKREVVETNPETEKFVKHSRAHFLQLK